MPDRDLEYLRTRGDLAFFYGRDATTQSSSVMKNFMTRSNFRFAQIVLEFPRRGKPLRTGYPVGSRRSLKCDKHEVLADPANAVPGFGRA